MTKTIDTRISKLSNTSLNYLKKAQMVLRSRLNRQDIAKETGIPYATVRTMVTRPERLNSTSWLNVMLLAEYYDRILPRLDRSDLEMEQDGDSPARPDLRTSSIVLNGKLFSDENYQDMSITAKLIYGYLVLPEQKRYKDEAGKEYVLCRLSDLERLVNHTRLTVKKALQELQDHGLLSDYESKAQTQRYYVHPITEAE